MGCLCVQPCPSPEHPALHPSTESSPEGSGGPGCTPFSGRREGGQRGQEGAWRSPRMEGKLPVLAQTGRLAGAGIFHDTILTPPPRQSPAPVCWQHSPGGTGSGCTPKPSCWAPPGAGRGVALNPFGGDTPQVYRTNPREGVAVTWGAGGWQGHRRQGMGGGTGGVTPMLCFGGSSGCGSHLQPPHLTGELVSWVGGGCWMDGQIDG